MIYEISISKMSSYINNNNKLNKENKINQILLIHLD